MRDMVNDQLVEHKRKLGNDVMVGTLTLLYDRLTHNQIMEVVLLQGPAKLVQDIANEMIAQRGVNTGHLQLMAAIIPPVHAASNDSSSLRNPV